MVVLDKNDTINYKSSFTEFRVEQYFDLSNAIINNQFEKKNTITW